MSSQLPLFTASSSTTSEELSQATRQLITDSIVQHSARPFDDSQFQMDSRFRLLSMEDFRLADEFMVDDPTARSAWDIVCNATCLGGLIAQHGGGANKGFHLAETESEIPWLDLGKEIQLAIIKYGVAAVTMAKTRHKDTRTGSWKLKMKPLLLNMQSFHVYYHLPVAGDPMFHIRLPANRIREMDDPMSPYRFAIKGLSDKQKQYAEFNGYEMHGVLVFWNALSDLPDQYSGRLRSRMLSLARINRIVDLMQQYGVQAARRLACPPLVTERADHGKEPEMQPMQPLGDTRISASSGSRDYSTANDRAMERLMAVRSQYATHEEFNQALYRHQQALAMSSAASGSSFGDRLDLDDERKVAKIDKPEAPKETYKLELARQQQVMLLFGIPSGMALAEHTGGKQSVGNTNHERLYLQTQLAFKSRLLAPLKILYMMVHRYDYIKQVDASAAKHMPAVKNGKISPREAANKIEDETKIALTIPSVPSLENLHQMYTAGVLKEEYLAHYYSAALGVPMEHLNKKPVIPRLDVLTEGKYSLQQAAADHDDDMQDDDHKHEAKQTKLQAGLAAKQSDRDHEHSKETEKIKAKAKAKAKPKAKKKAKK